MATFAVDELPGKRFPWYGRMSPELWRPIKQYVYQRDGGVCQWPDGCDFVDYIKSHCHHGLPLSEGGTNHPSNLKTLCQKHHKVRHPFMRSIHEKLWQGLGTV